MNRLWNLLKIGGLSLVLAGLLGGCASITPMDYRGEKPTLELENYFNGPLTAITRGPVG